MEPIKLDMLLMGTNKTPVLKVTGASNFNYVVESSTNLQTWEETASVVSTNGILYFADPAMTNSNKRFYRAITP